MHSWLQVDAAVNPYDGLFYLMSCLFIVLCIKYVLYDAWLMTGPVYFYEWALPKKRVPYYNLQV